MTSYLHGAIPRQRDRHRVLVVERIPTLRRAYTHALTTAGYDVEWADSGVEALALAEARAPGVAVVEVGRPVPDGPALITELRLRRVDVSVLAVAEEEYLECVARRAGAAAFLARPFGPHVLLPTVRMLLSGACRAAPLVLHECGGASDAEPLAAVHWLPHRG